MRRDENTARRASCLCVADASWECEGLSDKGYANPMVVFPVGQLELPSSQYQSEALDYRAEVLKSDPELRYEVIGMINPEEWLTFKIRNGGVLDELRVTAVSNAPAPVKVQPLPNGSSVGSFAWQP
jgi:hypothetical protein